MFFAFLANVRSSLHACRCGSDVQDKSESYLSFAVNIVTKLSPEAVPKVTTVAQGVVQSRHSARGVCGLSQELADRMTWLCDLC